MGRPRHAGLAELRRVHRCSVFVETGTGWGLGVEDALSTPGFAAMHSIEIDRLVHARNVTRFQRHIDTRWLTLWLGDSVAVLAQLAPTIPAHARVVWYLDAHFPGSAREEPMDMLPLREAPEDAVPLLREVESITQGRDTRWDVFIVDDRVMFESDAYEAGDTPAFRSALQQDTVLVQISQRLPHHVLTRLTADMGYAIYTPRE